MRMRRLARCTLVAATVAVAAVGCGRLRGDARPPAPLPMATGPVMLAAAPMPQAPTLVPLWSFETGG